MKYDPSPRYDIDNIKLYGICNGGNGLSVSKRYIQITISIFDCVALYH